MQQAIVASSTYFIARLAQNLGNGQVSILYIFLFALSLVSVYIPAYFAIVNLDQSKYDAHQIYNNVFHKNFLGKSSLLSDDTLQNKATSTLAQESTYTLSSVIDSIYDISALILNIVFNVLVIAWFLDKILLLGYILGIIFASLFVYLRRESLKEAAQNDQNSRLNLTTKLFEGWDNIILFNKHNYSLYNNVVNNSFKEAKNNSVKSESIRHINSSIGMIILMLPVFVITALIFKKNWADISTLAVLVATLPRQIQLLQMCYELISHYTNLGIIRTMLDGILGVLEPKSINLDCYIKPDQIKVRQTGEIFNPNLLPRSGRITLVGNNGVGKSCLLLKLKQEYQEQAYYLPAKHNLYFSYKETQSHKGSTGQQLIKQIEEIKREDKSHMLILDEWDANLDRENTEVIEKMLDEIAKFKLVIDVRH